MYLRASVAIITYNAEDTIRDCLASIFNQDIPKSEFEVLVVDGGSNDKTVDIARSFPDVRVVVERRRGRGLARNTAIQNSNADVVAFIDADCVAARDWLRTHLEILGAERLAALGGAVLCPPRASYLTQVQHHLYFGNLERREPRMTWDLATCNLSLRRQAVEEIGSFDEAVHQGEDTMLCWRLVKAGYEVYFHPGPKVTHLYRDMKLKDFLDMKLRDGITDYNLQLLFDGNGPYHLPTRRVARLATSPFLFGARILRYASKTADCMGLANSLRAFGYVALASCYWLAGYLAAPKAQIEPS